MSHKDNYFKFSDLVLEQVIFEAKFPVAFLHGDVAGSLWKELEESLPVKAFRVDAFDSHKIVGNYDERFTFATEIARFGVDCFFPKPSLEDFFEVFNVFYNLAVDRLKIEMFERIGCRQIFAKVFKNMKGATQALSSIPQLPIPEVLTQTHKEFAISPGWSFRVENDNIGKTYSWRVMRREFRIDFPIPMIEGSSRTQSYEQAVVIFDTDTYTIGNMDVGQFGPRDWIQSSVEATKRVGESFFKK